MGTKYTDACLTYAEPDEELFVLLERDEDAPELIERWVATREARGESQVKLDEARETARRFRERRAARVAEGRPYTKPAAGRSPACPACGNALHRVRQERGGMLNVEQFDSVKAGDWYCDVCVSDQARSGHRYFWNRELGLRDRP